MLSTSLLSLPDPSPALRCHRNQRQLLAARWPANFWGGNERWRCDARRDPVDRFGAVEASSTCLRLAPHWLPLSPHSSRPPFRLTTTPAQQSPLLSLTSTPSARHLCRVASLRYGLALAFRRSPRTETSHVNHHPSAAAGTQRSVDLDPFRALATTSLEQATPQLVFYSTCMRHSLSAICRTGAPQVGLKPPKGPFDNTNRLTLGRANDSRCPM